MLSSIGPNKVIPNLYHAR